MTVTQSRITEILTSILAPTKPLLLTTAYGQAAISPYCLPRILYLYSVFTDASVVFGSIRGPDTSNMGGIVFDLSWLLALPQAIIEAFRNS